jgi:hypothetical protein
MGQEAIKTLSVPELAPVLAIQATGGDPEKHTDVSKVETEHQDRHAAALPDNVEEQSIVYPRGIQFALISTSLCLCVFLVDLVSSDTAIGRRRLAQRPL